MPRLFNKIARKGSRSRSLVGRAASLFLNTLQNTLHAPATQVPASQPGGASGLASLEQPTDTVDTSDDSADETTSEDASSGSDVSEPHSSDSGIEDSDSSDEDEAYNASSDDEQGAAAPTSAPVGTVNAIPPVSLDGVEGVTQELFGGEMPLFSTFAGGVPSDQASPFPENLPFGYFTFSIAAGTTSDTGSVAATAVITGRDVIELQSHPSPTEGATSGDQLDEAFVEDPFAPCPLGNRGTKRPREAEEDLGGAGPSATSEELEERPTVRRRCSASPPRCTRETCLALNLHLLDGHAGPSRSESDDEDEWSNTAQASDTEPEHPEVGEVHPEVNEVYPEVGEVRLSGLVNRVARPGKRSRRRHEDSEEPGSPSKRSKRGL
ncbi:hypothetical protein PYCCODRAFT_1480519 [Trametes coccinea BRFM310]|uniref:Uncharacterized protein n=1 Tax=Trametes coccinea (strain BRFM310) TaxID=1353009 RepID=A0A1Y2IC06_TRAC3|nr:hypothetical protein PYCCODRAFT_1480519 [Trametes coccinea BRFM310]